MSTTTRPARRTGYRCARRGAGVRAGLAAEHTGGYGPAPGAGSSGPRAGGGAERRLGAVPGASVSPAASDEVATGGASVPFGLPVLAEMPRLASVLGHLEVADRAQLAAVAELSDLLTGDEVERTTGVGVDHWLAAVGRLTRLDRRLLAHLSVAAPPADA